MQPVAVRTNSPLQMPPSETFKAAKALAHDTPQIVIRPDVSCSPSRLRHFDVEFQDVRGEKVGGHIFTFDAQASERSINLRYRIEGDALQVLGQQRFFRAIAARRELPVIDAQSNSGFLITPTLNPGLSGRQLGTSFLPSAGSSLEECTLNALSDGESTTLHPTESWFSAQTVLNQFLSGIQTDLSLLLGTLRLAKEHGISLNIPISLESNSRGNNSAKVSTNHRVQFLSCEELRALLRMEPHSAATAYKTLCKEVSPPQTQFLTERMVEICAHGADTDLAPIITRRGLDAVDVAAYTWHDDTLHIVFKRGIRPVLAARSIIRNETYDPLCALTFEGIAESLEGEQTLLEVGERALQGVREEAGIRPFGTFQYLGRLFPLPEGHTEMTYSFAAEVDPHELVEADHSSDERVSVIAMPVREVVALCEQGVIRDPRLEINARLLELLTHRGTSGT